ncbi:MAG: hypothetical protein ACO3RV_04760, partial [Luteolibacter sp.]
LSRSLDDSERAIIHDSLETFSQSFRDHPEQAARLISTGESVVPDDIAPADLAAWTLIANQIFNLDETVTR